MCLAEISIFIDFHSSVTLMKYTPQSSFIKCICVHIYMYIYKYIYIHTLLLLTNKDVGNPPYLDYFSRFFHDLSTYVYMFALEYSIPNTYQKKGHICIVYICTCVYMYIYISCIYDHIYI